MKGTRLPDVMLDRGQGPALKPGEYVKVTYPNDPTAWGQLAGTVHWWVCTPNDHQGDVTRHTVTENADGTITVSPSILISDNKGPLWHGYLTAGVWSSC